MELSYEEDTPRETPLFDFHLVAKSLVPLLEVPRKSATVLGLHGPWGSGKTTLLDAIRRELIVGPAKDSTVMIEFNAWKFQDRQALWRALVIHVVGELRKYVEMGKGVTIDAEKLGRIEHSLYSAFSVEEKGPWKLNWKSLVIETISLLLSLVKLDFVGNAIKKSTGFMSRLFTWGSGEKKDKDEAAPIFDQARVDRMGAVLERETIKRDIDQIGSIEQFLEEFRKLLLEFTQQRKRVFVLIDDLDRCLPESALEVFESIKLFLDSPGCAYVVALDRDIIRKGLAVRYNRQGDAGQGQSLIDPDEYIEKTISVSFDLPRLSSDDVMEIINAFALPVKLIEKHHQLLGAALGTNPRRVKRFLNTLSVQLHLAGIAKLHDLPVDPCLLPGGNPDHFQLFLKLLLIAYRFSGVFSQMLEDPGLLPRLQKISNAYGAASKTDPDAAFADRKRALSAEVPLIASLHVRAEFWQLMGTSPNLLNESAVVARLQNWFRFRPPKKNENKRTN